MEQIFLNTWSEVTRFPLHAEFSAQSGACRRILDNGFQRIGERSFLECLRPKCVHGSARFTQTFPRQLTRTADVPDRVLRVLFQQCFFGRFHLNNYAGESLSEW